MSELIRGLHAEDMARAQEKLAALLVRQIALYTANASDSIPAATARELLDGLCFCLDLPERADELAGCADWESELRQGQRRAKEQAVRAYVLWQRLCRTLPPLDSRSLRDTLYSIGKGFRRYDARFFAHRFDCDIDYQLALPVSEDLQGIHYVNCYLENLAAENELLSRLPQREVRAVLERSCPDWRGLLVNLYAPGAANVLARVLLGEGGGLAFTDAEIERLRRRWEHDTPQEIAAELQTAADCFARVARLSEMAADYLRSYSHEVAVRAAALRDCDGLRGLFG